MSEYVSNGMCGETVAREWSSRRKWKNVRKLIAVKKNSWKRTGPA